MSTDVVVIGAGMVGAACAYAAVQAGLGVTVVDRGTVAGGTSGSGEGNILVSDKVPGPELELALLSDRLWRRLATELGTDAIEFDAKGGLVVAETADGLDGLHALADRQRSHGVELEVVQAKDLHAYEPHLAPGLAGGVHYPQDMQVQPMLATAHLLRAARALGARVLTGTEVTGAQRDTGGRLSAVVTSGGPVPADTVVNAAGPWAAELAGRLGTHVPVLARRGFVLVTEALPRVIRHKVYTAEYVGSVASSDERLESAAVVEGTRSGTVLIGASRERVGFDRTLSIPALRRLAAQAVRLFPFLADVKAIRAYRGFRPYCPDHLPVIGPDPHVPGVIHACGHEGAGIGLAPATGHLVAQLLTGAQPDLDMTPFRPGRFAEAA